MLHLQIVPGFRVGIVPVLGTMPSIFGMAAASHILCQLAEQPFNPEPIMEITIPQYETQISRLLEREETKFGNTDGVTVDYNDVSAHVSSVVGRTVFCSWFAVVGKMLQYECAAPLCISKIVLDLDYFLGTASHKVS